MGNDVSKEINDIIGVLDNNGKSCFTPTNVSKYGHFDPRSPTEGIVRTPIEVRKVLENSLNICSLRRRWKSESDLTPFETSGVCKDPVHILEDDPRSPTLGIVRTPIQVSCIEHKCEELYKNHHARELESINATMNVQDCRSPSLGISRTPIQVTLCSENVSTKDLHVEEPAVTSSGSKSPITHTWHTPLSKKCGRSSFVYADEDDFGKVEKKDTILQHEENFAYEKENDQSLKRKLLFTPESAKSAMKVRTPLGSRSNFQDSPSQLIKIMQVQKVGQELGNCENTGNNLVVNSKCTRKSHPVVEWDKDSTLIM